MSQAERVILCGGGVHIGEGSCDEWGLGVEEVESSGRCLVSGICDEIRGSGGWAMCMGVECSSRACLDWCDEGAVGCVVEDNEFSEDGVKDLCGEAAKKVVAKVPCVEVDDVVMIICFDESKLFS